MVWHNTLSYTNTLIYSNMQYGHNTYCHPAMLNLQHKAPAHGVSIAVQREMLIISCCLQTYGQVAKAARRQQCLIDLRLLLCLPDVCRQFMLQAHVAVWALYSDKSLACYRQAL